MAEERADQGWDDFYARVLRIEGWLHGLEDLVRETRAADGKLIEQRSDSLAEELERRADALLELVTARADAVLALGQSEREADQREYRSALAQYKQAADAAMVLLRDVHDTEMQKNYEQSHIEIVGVRDVHDLHINQVDERGKAALEQLAQRVAEWRLTDREARELQAEETSRRLDESNHHHERTQEILATSVTRDLWQAGNEAQAHRDSVLREQVVALDRALLGMNSTAAAESAHAAINKRMDELIGQATVQANAKTDALHEKLADMKERLDTSTGKSSGYSALYGWAVAAIGLIVTVIVAVNSTLS